MLLCFFFPFVCIILSRSQFYTDVGVNINHLSLFVIFAFVVHAPFFKFPILLLKPGCEDEFEQMPAGTVLLCCSTTSVHWEQLLPSKTGRVCAPALILSSVGEVAVMCSEFLFRSIVLPALERLFWSTSGNYILKKKKKRKLIYLIFFEYKSSSAQTAWLDKPSFFPKSN